MSVRFRWPVLLTLFCIAGDVPPRVAPTLMLGNTQLARGEYRVAVQTFRNVLASQPRLGRAQLGLAQGLAGMSRCDEALELLQRLRTKRAWGADAARAEGLCLLKTGDPLGAEASFLEATELAPLQARGWMQLAQVRGFLGDAEGADEAGVQLAGCAQGDLLWLLTEAELALRLGRRDVDGWIYAANSSLVGVPLVAIFDAQRWMDLDNPIAAEQLLAIQLGHTLNNFQVAFWRAEALRRLGRAEDAEAIFGRPGMQFGLDDGLAVAIRSRVWVDLGRIDEARALLDRHPDPRHPEALASRWYLALQDGDAASQASLSTQWSSLVHAKQRSLRQLRPWLVVGRP